MDTEMMRSRAEDERLGFFAVRGLDLRAYIYFDALSRRGGNVAERSRGLGSSGHSRYEINPRRQPRLGE